ncbi:MAG: DNA repair protein RadA, partial [Pseudomonadota bacterium]
MAKLRISYLCRACGQVHGKWSGQCEGCGAWNTLEEDTGLGAAGPASSSRALGRERGKGMALSALDADEAPPPRLASGMAELD